MTVTQLYRYLDSIIPSSLSCEWDNDGLMCCPDGNKEVKRVLVTLDVTAEAVEAAKREGCELIVSHHPLIFKGLKSISPENYISAKVIELIKSSVAVFSFHTRLDALSGGVNDVLAEKLGVKDTLPFGCDREAIGRIGHLDAPMSLDSFASLVKKELGAPFVLTADAGKEVYRVALLGGEGGDFVDAAIRAGADLFVSGRIGYHRMLDGAEEGIALIEAGHFATEVAVCQRLADLVREADPTVEIEIVNEPTICMVEGEKK